MKIFNIVFAILFVVFAGLQYNDPDPYLWIPIYLFAAFICFMGARKKFYPVLTLLGLLFYVGYALFLFFEKDGVIDWVTEHNAENIAGQMKAATPWIEDTREFFGLLLTSFALVMNYFYWKRLKKG